MKLLFFFKSIFILILFKITYYLREKLPEMNKNVPDENITSNNNINKRALRRCNSCAYHKSYQQ